MVCYGLNGSFFLEARKTKQNMITNAVSTEALNQSSRNQPALKNGPKTQSRRLSPTCTNHPSCVATATLAIALPASSKRSLAVYQNYDELVAASHEPVAEPVAEPLLSLSSLSL